jgi:hypothetical protein
MILEEAVTDRAGRMTMLFLVREQPVRDGINLAARNFASILATARQQVSQMKRAKNRCHAKISPTDTQPPS